MADRRCGNRAGFTLVEVLVALAIVSIALLAALRAAGQGTSNVAELRARLLAERGLIEMVEESALAPETLAAAIDRAALRPRRTGHAIDLGGAQRSAALLAQWTAELAW